MKNHQIFYLKLFPSFSLNGRQLVLENSSLSPNERKILKKFYYDLLNMRALQA